MRLGDFLRSKAKTEEADQSSDHVPGWRSQVQSIPVKSIRVNQYQPRRIFAQSELEELALSMRDHGILHPIVVRPADGGYELVVGERRLRASKMLGWERIPAIVREMTDAQVAEVALIENIQREDLGLFEEVEGLKRLIDEFHFTQEQLASRLGKSQSSIANKLRLLRLSQGAREIITRESLSERHARALLPLTDPEDQLACLAQVVEKGLNVRETELLVQKMLSKKDGERKRERQNIKGIYKDYRLLRNSVKQLVDQMNAGGAHVDLKEVKEEDFVEIRIRFHVGQSTSAEGEGA